MAKYPEYRICNCSQRHQESGICAFCGGFKPIKALEPVIKEYEESMRRFNRLLEFRIELTRLINKCGLDSQVKVPDFVLAQSIVDYLESIEQIVK